MSLPGRNFLNTYYKEKKMNKYLIKITLLAAISFLSACNHMPVKAAGIGMPKAPTEGPEEYIIGWKDGCKTGMSSYSSSYLRTMYGVTVDADAMKNINYSKGWRLGNRYCSYYTSRNLTLGYFDNAGFKDSDLRSDNTWFSLESDLQIFKGFKLPQISWDSGIKNSSYIGVDQDINTFMGFTGVQDIQFY